MDKISTFIKGSSPEDKCSTCINLKLFNYEWLIEKRVNKNKLICYLIEECLKGSFDEGDLPENKIVVTPRRLYKIHNYHKISFVISSKLLERFDTYRGKTSRAIIINNLLYIYYNSLI